MLTANPIERLIAAFEDRARRILRETPSQYPHAPITPRLKRFRKLHECHVDHLRNGRFLSAYAELVAIRDLSQQLERDEYGANPAHRRSKLDLRLRPGSFNQGRIVCGYLTGDIAPYSRRYRAFFEAAQGRRIAWPNLTGYLAGFLPQAGRQRKAIAFYERIVEQIALATPCEEGGIHENALVIIHDPSEEPGVPS